ncbi:MAG: acyl-CoA dehydrogenase domain protein [Frankiales bacterium]|nr:acyl-CoA dehydrogenase domain protein [Frankiales bacterium]
MFFGLSDDALALREGLREVLTTACTPATIRAAWDGDPCDALWKTLGEFGLIGLLAPESRGGLGLDALSFVAAMEEAGWHGVPGPLVETVAFHDYVQEYDGSVRLAVEHPGQSTIAYAQVATHILRLEGGVVLAGFTTEAVPTVDASRAAGAFPSTGLRVTVDRSAEPVQTDLALLGTSAFLLGLARRQLDLTVAYVKGRQQFGAPIGSFQAIKHPLADAVVGTEFAWPAVLRAAQSVIDGDDDRHLRVSMAKALASDASYRMSRVCLQAHGAMGYTVEYDLHLFAKRTWALAKDWGTASEHRAQIAKGLLQ